MSDVLKEVISYRVPGAYFADPSTTESFDRTPGWREARTLAKVAFVDQGMDSQQADIMANRKMFELFMFKLRRDIIIELADVYRESEVGIQDWTPELEIAAEATATATVLGELAAMNEALPYPNLELLAEAEV